MTLTQALINKLNKMNRAAQDAELGTLLSQLETGDATGNLRRITQTVLFSQFTDGGAAVGTFDITAGTIPAGATFLASAVTAVTGFAGDTSAVMTIGDGTDVDRYNTSTINVFATAANGVAAGAPSGVTYHTAAKTIKLTVTSATDFTAVNAGSVTVQFTYLV